MRGAIRTFALAVMFLLCGMQAASAAPTMEVPPEVAAMVQSLKPMRGVVPIAKAKATLDLGESNDFYGPQDASKILVDLWGNPPDSATDVLGLVMPAGASPLDEVWGAVVTYEDVGYVSDDDAAEVDFGEILTQLKESGEAANEERLRQGYPALHVIGWAENPSYDAKTHSVVWARDIRFGDAQVDTLNYDLRTLGRHGVLSVNFVSSMPELGSIQEAARRFAEHARFDTGARYEDYNELSDKKAEYGIAGLVAAGVGVAAVKKLGLLAVLAKFGKFIIIGAIALAAVLRKQIAHLFGRSEEEEQAVYDYADDPEEPIAPTGEQAGEADEQAGSDRPSP